MVMEKIDRPTRLIGFKSEDEIKTKQSFHINKRIYAYSAVLIILISVLSYLLITRSDVKTTILRAGGTLYQLRDKDKTVSNLYNAELINKTNRNIKFEIVPNNPKAKIQYIQKPDSIAYGGAAKLTFFVILPQNEINTYKSEIGFKLVADDKIVDHFETTFIAPPNN
ncbi:Ubp3 associated protein Bre5 [compost metagenome]